MLFDESSESELKFELKPRSNQFEHFPFISVFLKLSVNFRS